MLRLIVHISIFWYIATIFVVAGTKFTHPDDLQSIVDSVKKDVDQYLKLAAYDRHLEPVHILNQPEPPKSTIIDNFMGVIHDSMHHHLGKKFDKASDVEEDGQNFHAKPATVIDETKSVSGNSSPENIFEHTDESSDVYEILVGSTKGRPGVNFPNYADIPKTSFTCSGKTNLPGFYADLDTGCQVFHVCWPDRRESFLCPLGTTFNQALQVCDYWYNFNCSLASLYYAKDSKTEQNSSRSENLSMINTLLERADSGATSKPKLSTSSDPTASVLSFASQFMPVKAKIVFYPKTKSQRSKIVTTASIGEKRKAVFKSKSRQNSRKPRLSRVPLSVEETSTATNPLLEDLKSKIDTFRYFEALNNAVIDVKKDDAVSNISAYAESIPRLIKYWFMMDKSPEMVNIEPGSELHEYDIAVQEKAQLLQYFLKKILVFAGDIMYEIDNLIKQLKQEASEEDTGYEASTPLTYLNTNFIVQPANEKMPKFKTEETLSNLVKMRMKRAAEILNPLKSTEEESLRIYPQTKAALLKNYVKRFKTKFA